MQKLIVSLILILMTGATLLYLSPATLLASMQLIERQRAELDLKQINGGDLSIHYYEGGPSDAQTILMVHGFAANKDNWLRFASHLTQAYRVITLDLPGFGASSKPAGIIDALYASRYPNRVASLTILDNAGITSPHPSELHLRLQRGEANPLAVRSPALPSLSYGAYAIGSTGH